MVRKLSILSFVAAALFFAGCNTEDGPDSPWGPGYKPHVENEDDKKEEIFVKPIEKADNIVIAHRGAVKEFGGTPDNSLASLRNAIALGCYGSELDIYWTKDNDVIVAHADGNCQINRMYPWQCTVSELRGGGVLSNGEILPTLKEYIEVAVTEGKCTKLILDIKNITTPTSIDAATRAQYCINACRRSIEIAQQIGAEEYIEFICTGNATVMTGCAPLCEAANIPIGWMANKPASDYEKLGVGCKYAYRWANMSLEYMNDGLDNPETGKRTIDEFVSKGIEFSVYNADTDAQMEYYMQRADKLKAICTNYPKKLLQKMGKR